MEKKIIGKKTISEVPLPLGRTEGVVWHPFFSALLIFVSLIAVVFWVPKSCWCQRGPICV